MFCGLVICGLLQVADCSLVFVAFGFGVWL